MRIYYTVTNNYEGSYGVEYFDDQEAIDLLVDHDPEGYPSESDGSFDCDHFIGTIRNKQDAINYLVGTLGISEDFINGND